ncbi:capsular exopolysaccharide synthesis family protein [Algoriphagus ratkowskyi]|uniref:non-specific protein-tyrosine kinase n=1 Tax=Algoriphagus ratkowskyi TaxID=57028 RepID=A0A2W7QSQ0_9BACT|nr:AAA family ATPase [Algoriphagus ratkowskyi]PZX51284.1 capsular exopolysaccharide synthesis family protein [Algoriphagus ratkowskyi]TXD75926.1 AAA family ATPase [Algoriphagus ratkowskyi]
MRKINKKVNSNEEPINIKLILRTILKSWYLFPIFILLFCGVAYYYIKTITPEYLISSVIIIKEGERNNNVTENSIVSDLENMKSTITVENELEKLKSKSLLMDAVIKNKGFINYYNAEDFFKTKIDPFQSSIDITVDSISKSFISPSESFEIQPISETKFLLILDEDKQKEFEYGQKIKFSFGIISIQKKPASDDFATEMGNVLVELVNPQVAAENYSRVLEFQNPSVKSSTLYIRLYDTSPEMGKQIMSSVIEGYNQRIINQKNETALKTINFINERLGIVKNDLEEFEKSGENFKTRNNITDISMNSKIYLENTAETRKQVAEVSGKIDILESIELTMNNQSGQFDLIPGGLADLDPSLSGLLTQYNTLQRDKQRIIRIVQPNNPQLLSLNDQIVNVKSNILANISSIKSNLLISKRNFETTLNENSYKAQSIPGIERELVEISRNTDLKQEQYQYLLRKRDEAVLTLEVTGVSSAQMVDPPIASLKPVKPNKLMIMAAALGLGLSLPLGLILVNYLVTSKVTSKRVIEKILNAQILGEIAKNDQNGVIAISPKSISPAAEQLRMIRSNLKFQSGDNNKVILVSSSMSGEGKTFFCLNLAATLSIVDKKVVVVDLDLRRPSIFKSLNIKSKHSLFDYLNHDIKDLKEIITPSGINSNMDIIGLNKSIENASEIITSQKIIKLINSLKSSYDHIIIDTSPIGLVADAYSLSEIVDLVVYVVRMNYTRVDNLHALAEIIDENIFKQNFVVLNDSNEYSGSKFGYGYYSGKDTDVVSTRA